MNAYTGEVLHTNSPNGSIDYRYREGAILPLRFQESQNIAFRVLDDGQITAPTSGRGLEKQLEHVNGDHEVAFERKPTYRASSYHTRYMDNSGLWYLLVYRECVFIQETQ